MTRSTSAVIMSRNDDYGGNLRMRATLCLNYMVASFDEVVYVDYNSEERSLLDEIRGDLALRGNLRHIRVSPDQHRAFVRDLPGAPPCVEVLGRNIGLRRARGDVLVSTNIDIIPPPRDTLARFLADGYEPHTFYTLSRRDIDITPFDPRGRVYGERLRTALIAEMRRIPPKRDCNREDEWSRILFCGDFQLAHRAIWHAIRGFEETMVQGARSDTQVQMKSELAAHPVRALFDLPVFHINHGTDDRHKTRPVQQFAVEPTKNPETWGFADTDFPTEVV